MYFCIFGSELRVRVTWTEGSSFPGRLLNVFWVLLGLKVPV